MYILQIYTYIRIIYCERDKSHNADGKKKKENTSAMHTHTHTHIAVRGDGRVRRTERDLRRNNVLRGRAAADDKNTINVIAAMYTLDKPCPRITRRQLVPCILYINVYNIDRPFCILCCPLQYYTYIHDGRGW